MISVGSSTGEGNLCLIHIQLINNGGKWSGEKWRKESEKKSRNVNGGWGHNRDRSDVQRCMGLKVWVPWMICKAWNSAQHWGNERVSSAGVSTQKLFRRCISMRTMKSSLCLDSLVEFHSGKGMWDRNSSFTQSTQSTFRA